MKKLFATELSAAMLLFMLTSCGGGEGANASGSGGQAPARKNTILTFGTGDTGGSLYPVSAALSQVWTNQVEGVKCNTQTSTGEVDVAVYTSVSSNVALKSSGLEYVHDLLGKRVAVGPAASATENSMDAFKAMGIDAQSTSLKNLSLGDGADSIGDGILDAAFGFAGLHIGGQLNLAATKDIVVLNYTQEEINQILAGNEAYIQAKIPANTYTGQDKETLTFDVKDLIIVSKDMDEQMVYDMCKAMNENTAHMAAGNALLNEMTGPKFLATNMPIPLHDDATRYYTEQGLL